MTVLLLKKPRPPSHVDLLTLAFGAGAGEAASSSARSKSNASLGLLPAALLAMACRHSRPVVAVETNSVD
jgi:hypothetical protein